MKTWMLAVVALSALGSEARAQTRQPRNASPLVNHRLYTGGLREARLDLATGVITRGPSVENRGAATVADFSNTDRNGFVVTAQPSVAGVLQIISSAAKGETAQQSHNQSDLLRSIRFAYCTGMADVQSGGPGGSTNLSFYEGYTLFANQITTTVALLNLTGLPGGSASADFFSTTACFDFTVQLNDMVTFRDTDVLGGGGGNNQGIGYGWHYVDVNPIDGTGATFPFVSCVMSCSGVSGPPFIPDGQGQIPAVDLYAPPGKPNYLGTFFFSTASNPFGTGPWTSVNMEIREAADLATTSNAYNATITPNADTLTATPATLGGAWSATITKAVPSAASTWTLIVKSGKFPGNGGAPTPPITGRILTLGSNFGNFTGLAHDGSTGTFNAGIPARYSLLCVHFAAQARTNGGGIRLSSAIEGTTGTF